MTRKGSSRTTSQVTAEDVARSLGVSQSTISRAFSTTASISEKTKLRVLETANALGYQPNIIARSLITRRTNIVAVVVANLVDPFYPVVLDELAQHIQSRGFQTLLFIPTAGQDVDDVLPKLLQYQIDAVVLASATLSSAMARVCAERKMPLVLFNRYVPGLEVHAVSCDNIAGGRRVAEFLRASGHVRPAFVSGETEATTNRDRQHGFVSRLTELGIRTCMHEEGGEYSYEAGYDATKRLLRHRKRPDAIFFASDVVAFGGMDMLRQAGLRIPQDISVVGYDDVPLAAWCGYDLTTIRQPIRQMVEASVDMLGLGNAHRVAAAPTTRLIMGTLIERSSTSDRRRAPRLHPKSAARAAAGNRA
jgi:DNA-binding LacI/PurR family transcriptional regulator